MKKGLNLDNLMNTYYYNGEYELEFYVDERYVFVRNIKEQDHPNAAIDEYYFDDFEVIDEIVKNTEDANIEVIKK